MFIKDFIEKFHDKYEYDYDSNEPFTNQIRLIYNIEKEAILDNVFIYDNDDSTFNIYKEFLYEESDSPMRSFNTQKEELLFLQFLRKNSSYEPETCFDDGMGCPFNSVNVGYFGITYNWDTLLNMLGEIEKACITYLNTDIDINFCKEFLTFEYDNYLEEQKKIFKSLQENSNLSNYIMIKDSFRYLTKGFTENDLIYVNKENTVILGLGDETLTKIGFHIIVKDIKLKETYKGLKYFFGKNGSQTICANIDYIEDIYKISEKISYDYDYEPSFYINSSSRILLMLSDSIWAAIGLLENDKLELYINEEKNLLNNLFTTFKNIVPDSLLYEPYDFSKLNAGLFEKMCRDLLINLGFKNVVIRGDTKSSDGGVDIEADEECMTLFDTEIRHWIFQCKHTKNQIDRKDLYEIEHLLDEFSADCYGIFYSHIFTPATIDRIKTLSKRFKIGFWDKNSIETFLNKYAEVSKRYFRI